MLDTTYCSYIHCPFEDCERHASRLQKLAGTGVEVRVSWLCDSCRRYIGWLIEEGSKPREREDGDPDAGENQKLDH